MNRALTFVNAVLLIVFLYGQKIEYTIHLNAGKFFYTGNEARSGSFLNSSLPGNVAEAHANVLTAFKKPLKPILLLALQQGVNRCKVKYALWRERITAPQKAMLI